MKSAVKIAILILIAVLFVSGLSLYLTYSATVPSLTRNVTISQLGSEVAIDWSDYKVPLIHSDNERDAFVAAGYIHASDRIWQMTRQQYKLEGLHSKEIHESLLHVDRFYLTMGFGENARRRYENMPPEQKALLEAYAEGVNAFVRLNQQNLPVAFSLSDARPVLWEPWHSIGVHLLWAWEYQQSFWTKPAFHQLHGNIDPDLAPLLTGTHASYEQLFGSQPPVIDTVAQNALAYDFKNFTERIAPARTIEAGTGLAFHQNGAQASTVLFSIMESRLTMPDQFYQMAFNIGGQRRTGMTLPGYPVILQGQNESMAWSVRPDAIDDGDFFSGQLFSDSIDSQIDWQRDASVPEKLSDHIDLDRTILQLKNESEYHLVMLSSFGRPIVALSEEDNRYLSFHWNGFTDIPDFGAYFGLNKASNVRELRDAADDIRVPAAQILYATSAGETGRLHAGELITDSEPLRIRSSDEAVTTQKKGSVATGEHQNKNAALPVLYQEMQENYRIPENLKSLYSPPWNRPERFVQLLQNTSANGLERSLKVNWHHDTYSMYAERLISGILANIDYEDTESQLDVILPYLENWNYEYNHNETAASLFELFLYHSANLFFREFFDRNDQIMLFRAPNIPLSTVTNLIESPEMWPDNHSLSLSEWILQSMVDTIDYLTDYHGKEPHEWQWGSVIHGSFKPALFPVTTERVRSARLAQNNLFMPGIFQVSGTSHTISASHINFSPPFTVSVASTVNQTMFPDSENQYYSTLSTGQSGNIFSSHYKDQFLLWKEKRVRTESFGLNHEDNQVTNRQLLKP